MSFLNSGDIIQKRTDPGDFQAPFLPPRNFIGCRLVASFWQEKLLSNLDDCYEDFETLQVGKVWTTPP